MTLTASTHAFKVLGDEARSRTLRVVGGGVDPTPESAFTLARRLFTCGDLEGALQILDGEVSAGRENADVLRLIARTALRLGDEARAERALERAVALAPPDDVVSHIRLVRLLLRHE